jgi:peptidoglycan hydrolase-like protein with peptidoglycan-binding domain
MLTYGILLVSGYRVMGTSGAVTSRNIEFDHWEGRLPTTRILRFVHQAVDRSHWVQVPNTLQMGNSDGLVYSLQLTLNNRIVPSPNIAVDGDFGGETFRAVQRFQTQAGLPTTGIVDAATWQALGPLIDAQTGKALPPFNSAATVATPAAGIAVVGGGSFQEDPPREVFMPIGHCWWAVLLGYFGGLFGLVTYRRRTKEPQPPAAAS